MRTAKWHKPLHPPLTDFPAALWITGFVFDICSYFYGRSFTAAAFYCFAAGCVVAVLAALAGVLDFTRIGPRPDKAKSTALIHAGLNVLALMLFAVNLWARARTPEATSTPIPLTVLSGIGVALVISSAWLGGRLVYDMGVNVKPVRWEEPAPILGKRETTATTAELPTTRPFIPGRDVTLREPGAPRGPDEPLPH